MHEVEISVDLDLVTRLLAKQFPQLAHLELQRVRSAGTDNALFRLGKDFVVRMPIVDWAVPDVEKENKWLPYLAPLLPISIPTPIAMGMPEEGYPYNWSIYRWCSGENPRVGELERPLEFASDVAKFIRGLQEIDIEDGPAAGRGLPLIDRDESTREALASLSSMMETREIDAAWSSALTIPAWDKPNVWIHGDLSSGNVLTLDGRLSAVIDFGALGVGDPAVDLIIAWNLLPVGVRSEFRSLTQVDEATWKRGRAWAYRSP